MKTPITNLLRKLIDQNCPLDTMAKLIFEMEKEQAALAAATTRARDSLIEQLKALRLKQAKVKRDYRARKNGISVCPVDIEKNALSSSSVSIKKTLSIKKELKSADQKKSSRGTTLPDDWKPEEKHYALGEHLGHSESAVNAMAEEMRDWAHANSNRAVARKADWGLTFNGWIRRAKPVRSRGDGPSFAQIAAGRE